MQVHVDESGPLPRDFTAAITVEAATGLIISTLNVPQVREAIRRAWKAQLEWEKTCTEWAGARFKRLWLERVESTALEIPKEPPLDFSYRTWDERVDWFAHSAAISHDPTRLYKCPPPEWDSISAFLRRDRSDEFED